MRALPTLIALLMLSTAACAQSRSGGCSLGSSAWSSSEDDCWRQGGKFYPQNPQNYMPTIACTGCSCGVLGCGSAGTSAAPAPKCEDGWTLVADQSMQPMCARELRAPR